MKLKYEIKFDKEIAKKFKKAAKECGCSFEELVKDAVDLWLELDAIQFDEPKPKKANSSPRSEKQ